MSTPALTGVVAARPTPKHQGATVPIAQPIRERLILKPAQKRGATATQEHELCCKPKTGSPQHTHSLSSIMLAVALPWPER
jgi:hypothetical protein